MYFLTNQLLDFIVSLNSPRAKYEDDQRSITISSIKILNLTFYCTLNYA